MLEYTGKYGKAKVMVDEIDEATVSQIYEFLNHEVFTNPIVIMPDTHAGAGAVIGFTMEMTDKVIPNVVGVDLGCGMMSMKLAESPFKEYKRHSVDRMIRQSVPFGQNVQTKRQDAYLMDRDFQLMTSQFRIFTTAYNNRYNTHYEPVAFSREWVEEKCEQIRFQSDRFWKSIGTLGGGNHFIEFGQGEDRANWLTIHTGSRQFGYKIAEYWQKKAGKGQLAHLEGDDMFGYLTDMYFAQQYANINRLTIAYLITNKILGIEVEDVVFSTHNFINFSDFIIRKGAINAYEERIIIPFNMEDGTLICKGKANPEWNYSAPHGAGRISSRSKAKKKLKRIEESIKNRMVEKGIYCSTLPLDEAKEAYKDPKLIEDAIEPTAEIVERIKPIMAMKSKK
jgi:RNA-splicing ligase RtcB